MQFGVYCLYYLRKMPEKEEENLTPATRLLEKKREMAEVEAALAAEKEVRL
jgi:hypothetical protein